MALPESVTNYINENAQREGVAQPESGDNLFKSGVLDSFSLVDLVALLEDECGIKIPDGDVSQSNFETLTAIENYITGKKDK